MKCSNCHNNIKEKMSYCPYCGCDITNEIKKYIKIKKITKICIIALTVIIIVVLFIYNNGPDDTVYNNPALENEDQFNDMASSICYGDYDMVYTSSNLVNQGIIQCQESNYVYYVNDLKSMCGLYICGEIYEMGYTYHDIVEEFFPNGIYLYRESRVVDISDELKIAVVANSEEDLIANYAETFYRFVKRLNKDDIQLIVYFYNTLSGIETTYDKLFLMAGYNTNNVTQAFGLGKGYGEYIFYDGDPEDLLNTIFLDRNNYPENARNAIKNNRNINLTITNGRNITYDEFLEEFSNSFDEPY